MKRIITNFGVAAFLVLFAQIAMAQTVISGKVTDAATGSPLVGINVQVKSGAAGATTDLNGAYRLSTTAALPLKLMFSSIGYSTKEVTVSTASGSIDVALSEQVTMANEVVVSASRVEESITRAGVTVEKMGPRQFQQSAAASTFDAIQNLKGVDLLTQSLTFKSVNLRGFGANNNNRFVQLTDGMDNRSPGLGFGFGAVAGVPDIDVESIEVIPGASSALYGPDALQGLMLTRSKDPFEYQGLSAQMKFGFNNIGKSNINPKLFSDIMLRYAEAVSDKLAYKVSFEMMNGTDFIADDYSDRLHRGRRGFFVNDANTRVTRLGYAPNNDPTTNFEFDGVNIYGDDFNNGGAFDFAANYSNPALAGKRVTRTGYTEYDLIGNQGKVFSTRASASVHYKVAKNMELIGGLYYGNGNFIRTAGFREYFPDYRRTQIKLELKGDNFFIRGYTTNQNAEGYNLGNLAARLLTKAKTTANWATDFATRFNQTGSLLGARNYADELGKFNVGTANFIRIREELISTPNNRAIPSGGANGVRLLDNSSMMHFEGMYNFNKLLPENVEVITGASYRLFDMDTKGTIFPLTNDGKEFSFSEVGAYLQASYILKLGEKTTFKPTAAVRYDKNEFFQGGFTPRISGVLSIGEHNFRGSWQSAFRNPSANQILADGKIGEVGGSQAAADAAGLFTNPAYTEASVRQFQTSGNASDLVKYTPAPEKFTTEKIKTWEIGYKTLIDNKLFIDAFYFGSTYTDFIATQNYNQLVGDKVGDINNFRTASNYRTLQINFNNFNEIFVSGYGFGLEYGMGKGYTISGNFANQVGKITLRNAAGTIIKDPFGQDIVERKMSDPEVAAVQRNFFISPENRYNITFANARLTKSMGFAVTYRWTDTMWVEQGTTQGDIWLPSWNTVDAQVSFRMPAMKSILKVGATNLFNNYYSQGYGLAQIGGLYYVSLNFDQLMR